MPFICSMPGYDLPSLNCFASPGLSSLHSDTRNKKEKRQGTTVARQTPSVLETFPMQAMEWNSLCAQSRWHLPPNKRVSSELPKPTLGPPIVCSPGSAAQPPRIKLPVHRPHRALHAQGTSTSPRLPDLELILPTRPARLAPPCSNSNTNVKLAVETKRCIPVNWLNKEYARWGHPIRGRLRTSHPGVGFFPTRLYGAIKPRPSRTSKRKKKKKQRKEAVQSDQEPPSPTPRPPPARPASQPASRTDTQGPVVRSRT